MKGPVNPDLLTAGIKFAFISAAVTSAIAFVTTVVKVKKMT